MNYLTKGINVSCRSIQGFAYILVESTSEFFCLNETGSYIWSLINGKNSVSKIVESVIDEYEGEASEIEIEVVIFIQELDRQNMIMSSPTPFKGVLQSD